MFVVLFEHVFERYDGLVERQHVVGGHAQSVFNARIEIGGARRISTVIRVVIAVVLIRSTIISSRRGRLRKHRNNSLDGHLEKSFEFIFENVLKFQVRYPKKKFKFFKFLKNERLIFFKNNHKILNPN